MVDLRKAGAALGAQYLIEGSLRKIGNRIRLTAQLIDVESGNHIWADRYDREFEDIFAVQDELVHAIVTTLSRRLSDADVERSLRKRPQNLAAYDYYLRDLQSTRYFTAETVANAREMFEKAVALDPSLARAHAQLAWNVCVTAWWEPDVDELAYADDALRIAQQAVSLDPDDNLCHSIVALIHILGGSTTRPGIQLNVRWH